VSGNEPLTNNPCFLDGEDFAGPRRSPREGKIELEMIDLPATLGDGRGLQQPQREPREFRPPKQEIGDEARHCRKVYKAALTSRILESKLSSLYKAGKIVGGVYLGKGQEAVSASLGACLEMKRDVFAPLIRDQAGRTAFGEELLDVTRTYLGAITGPMKGRDGNIHRGRPNEGLLAMISHLGTAPAVVAGMLVGKRFKGTMEGSVGATCIGDGGTSTGAFHEGMNLAAVEKLPMVVVVANNQYAYSTPNERQFACRNLVDRAEGYGFGAHEIDGTDFLDCVTGVRQAVELARSGEGPQLVVAEMLRLTGHGEHDDASYVKEKLRTGPVGRDCMEVARQQMIEKGLMTEAEITEMEVELAKAVQEAVAIAQKEAKPSPYEMKWTACEGEGMDR